MERERDEEHDLVVVGSGAAAMAAALLAARRGLETVVLEKTEYLGGTSAYSGAAAWLPGSAVQRRLGSSDSTDSARAYLRALLGDREAEKQEAFLATAPEVVAALEEDPDVEFTVQPFPDYFDAPGRVPGGRSIIPTPLPVEALRAADLGADLLALVRPPVERDRAGLGHHPTEPLIAGRALIGRLLLGLHRTGRGTVRVRSRVVELLAEGDRVVGVVVEADGVRRRVRARHGVLLAAGGFERSPELRERHGVPGDAAWAMAPAGSNTGEPMAAAVALGAATELMDQGWWCPGILHPDGAAAFTLGLRGGIVLDEAGRRFANESLPYDRMGRRMFAVEGRVPAWLVFDSRFDGDLPAISLPPCPPEEHLAAGTWVAADSLAGLAEATGLPADALRDSVARFNGFAAEGADADFGRGEDEYDAFFATGDGPNPALVPIDTAPYYAARLVLADLGTKGGLRTDADARVLRVDGSPIRGLYAAGNTSASMSGEFYPGPGVPIGTGIVFGWRAVRSLLASLDRSLVE